MNVILIAIFTVLSVLPILGQDTAPQSLPIGSYAEIRAYAAEESKMLGIGAFSQSGTEYGFAQSYWENPKSSDEINNSLKGTRLVLEIINPKDPISMHGHIYNKDYDLMFYGWKFSELYQSEGQWKLPQTLVNFNLN
jgi:hypothetical protein